LDGETARGMQRRSDSVVLNCLVRWIAWLMCFFDFFVPE
jgi:hypothetical protein